MTEPDTRSGRIIPQGLPEGYDLNKEPVAPFRCKSDSLGSLSGSAYVLVLEKGEHRAGRVRIRKPQNCEHGQGSICTGGEEGRWTCASSWQIDYSILWSRTEGGRKLLSQLGIQADKYHNPEHPAH